MKVITAVIKQFRLEEVKDALLKIDLPGMTVTEARGFGRQRGRTETYRGAEYAVDFLPKVRIEIVADDEHAARIATLVADIARTDRIGDGKVWVTPVETLIRVRTGELDVEAL